MAEPTDARMIAQAVARYFSAGRGDKTPRAPHPRPSVDQLIQELFPHADADARADARASLIGALSQAARSGAGRTPSADEIEPDELEALPEIPGYDIIEEIGRGGMGVVYEAYQRSTGRRVAIKFMRGGGRALALRFEREIDLLARLSHPGVVSVLDSSAASGRWYYVMEYVDGRPLDAHIPPGTADPRATLALLASVAEVVNEAHQRGVLHRDLKPANILVERDGRVRLLDFGLAKAIDPESGAHAELTISDAGRPMGTLAYMPPEQAAGGSKGISVRSDVYALGVIGFYLLTGRHPIDIDGKLIDVVQRIQTSPIARPSSIRAGLNADIDAIITKATAKLPQDRYPTAADLASDIRRWLAGAPITARMLPRSVRAWRWIRRNRVLVAVVSLCLGLLATMGWVSVGRIIDERDRANALLLETFAQFRQVDGMEELARQRIKTAEQLYGAGSRFHAIAIIQLGLVLERLQRHVEAEVYLKQGLDMVRNLRAATPADLSIACLHHGRVLVWAGRMEEARAALEESAAIASTYGPMGEPTLAQARTFIGLSWATAESTPRASHTSATRARGGPLTPPHATTGTTPAPCEPTPTACSDSAVSTRPSDSSLMRSSGKSAPDFPTRPGDCD
jgi:predicted Ser/Thr protein kinase